MPEYKYINITQLTKKSIELSLFGILEKHIEIIDKKYTTSYYQSLDYIYKLNPMYCGIYVDYLVRKTISCITNQPFNDMRADHVIKYKNPPKKLIDSYNYCKSNNTELCLLKLCDVMQFHSLAFHTQPNIKIINSIKTYLETNYFDLKPLMIDLIKDNKVILNPDLGLTYNKLKIKGDADLIIGRTLYDIKCTKNNSNTYLRQLLAYMALISIKYKNITIDKICILNLYRSEIIYYNVAHITNEMLLTYMTRLNQQVESTD